MSSFATVASWVIASKNLAVFVKLVALSEYKNDGCPLLHDNSHNASKNVKADKLFKVTRYTALVTKHENKHTQILIFPYPCLTSKGPHKSTPTELNGA